VDTIGQVYCITFLRAVDLWGSQLGTSITSSQFPIVIISPAIDTTIRYCSTCVSIWRSKGNYPWKQASNQHSLRLFQHSPAISFHFWHSTFVTSAVIKLRFILFSDIIAAFSPSTAYCPAAQALQLVEPVQTRRKIQISVTAVLGHWIRNLMFRCISKQYLCVMVLNYLEQVKNLESKNPWHKIPMIIKY
jgi:hypothetical protein